MGCLLQHWYELRLPGEALGTVNTRRFLDLRAASMVHTRQGRQAFRSALLAASRHQRVIDPAYIPVAAGLFPGDLQVEAQVRSFLASASLEHRVAALYATVFFFSHADDVLTNVTERVVLEADTGLQLAASRDVLDIWRDTRHGGHCPRCGRDLTAADQNNWIPSRTGRA